MQLLLSIKSFFKRTFGGKQTSPQWQNFFEPTMAAVDPRTTVRGPIAAVMARGSLLTETSAKQAQIKMKACCLRTKTNETHCA